MISYHAYVTDFVNDCQRYIGKYKSPADAMDAVMSILLSKGYIDDMYESACGGGYFSDWFNYEQYVQSFRDHMLINCKTTYYYIERVII